MSMWTAIALIAIAGIVAGIFNDKGKRQDNKAINGELKVIHEKLDEITRKKAESAGKSGKNRHQQVKQTGLRTGQHLRRGFDRQGKHP